MSRATVWLLSLFLFSPALFSDGGSVTDFRQAIPRTIRGWKAAGDDRTYDRRTIFDYMDGGAEVYLAFDFREVWSRKYKGPGGGEMTLDVFDMGSPGEAFGAFSCDREDPGAGIGQESEYGGGLLRFWQGRYFVTVTASGEGEDVRQAVLALGKETLKHLGPGGAKPGLVGHLPAAGLKPDRTSYFHALVNLNNRFFVSADNILRLDRRTDCVIGEYATPAGDTAHLLIVRYPDPGKALEARASFLAAYLPEAGPDGLGRTEDKKWVLASLRGNELAVIFEAPAADWAKALAASIPSAIK
jgi:hypothetical protein